MGPVNAAPVVTDEITAVRWASGVWNSGTGSECGALNRVRLDCSGLFETKIEREQNHQG
jgi:hypothetical protein